MTDVRWVAIPRGANGSLSKWALLKKPKVRLIRRIGKKLVGFHHLFQSNRDSKIAHHFSLVLTPSFPEAIASILRLFVLLSCHVIILSRPFFYFVRQSFPT